MRKPHRKPKKKNWLLPEHLDGYGYLLHPEWSRILLQEPDKIDITEQDGILYITVKK